MSTGWTPPKSRLEEGVRGLHLEDVAPETQAVMSKLHLNREATNPLVMPIYNSTTYLINSVADYVGIIQGEQQAQTGYIYSRLGSPTTEELECTMKALEGGVGSLAVSSGMAAACTVMLGLLKSGDHVVAQNPIYSGVHRFLTKDAPNLNIEYTWVTAGCSVDDFRKAMKDNTRLLIAETPSNPLISVVDLEELGKLGLSTNGRVYTMVDSTYAPPYLQQPCKYGIDITIHSGTKYLSGHSDLLAGIITTRTMELYKQLNVFRTTLGPILSAFDAFLLCRGIKTLHVRMDRHCENAEKVAHFLQGHHQVATVHYPGLPSHPGHEVAKRQMKKFGGMISFEVKGGLAAAKTVVESVRVIQLAVSLGGVESLIEHPATMTHGPMIMSDAERSESLITDGLIRLSVGLENAEDLIKDLQRALDKIED